MLSVKKIIEQLGCLEFIGNLETKIDAIIQLDTNNIRDDVIFWCGDKKIELISKIKHGTVICSKLVQDKNINNQCNFIVVDNPRIYFSNVVKKFFYKPFVRQGISSSAKIHPTVVIGDHCFVGDHVVIEENCVIGNGCVINHNTVIHADTIIKNNVRIGCNNTIGGVGFGYQKNESGQYEALPHIGNVVIEDNVEIGNNTCIDRAVLGSTLIKRNAKVDNLVHIAHGVVVGENSLIIANAMIGGSTTIGNNVWIAPSAAVINKTTIGDNALVGLSAVVIKPVKENTIVIGNPAKELEK